MYSLFNKSATRFTGRLEYPGLPYIRRLYVDQIKAVKAYYHRFPKRVDSDNVLGNILQHIPQRNDLDDQRYLRFVDDAEQGVSRAFGLTSSLYRGRVHESGITLGPKTDEIMISSYTPINTRDIGDKWVHLSPLSYLYHTRTDMSLPIENNSTPGKGNGVSVINIPLMALQYRYWLKYQANRFDQKESVYRFIGGFVLPNAVGSFLEIAFFNRLSRYATGVGVPKIPLSHPFYLTDLTGRIEQYCKWIIDSNDRRTGDIEQFVGITPMILKNNLYDVMQIPKDPVTRQNEWALQIARLPYIRYITEVAIKKHQGDKKYINDIYLSLIDANQDNLFSGVGSPNVVKLYRSQIRRLISELEELNQGWT